MANLTLGKINYQIGRLCRLGSRKAKLMAISNRRKQQLRHLGERIYIFKALQQDEDIWEKDEISQLLLTIADLDQEQEMLIDEINEIKAENPPETLDTENQEESPAPENAATADSVAANPIPKAEVKVPEVKAAIKPEVKKEVKKKATAKPVKKEASAAKPKTARKKAAPSKSKAKATKEN
ncbi:MAG: hypothetical protein DRH03_01490 [Deltaproteobacteria bacterium]|nr:MAG: hypothetical protein DRH03_01490 [Deltaproteobacteria bacterium]